jgi:hypothetical protein
MIMGAGEEDDMTHRQPSVQSFAAALCALAAEERGGAPPVKITP